MKIASILAGAALAILTAGSVRAEYVKFDYTGGYFNQTSCEVGISSTCLLPNPYTTADRVTGYIEIDLGSPTQTFTNSGGTFGIYDLSDGPATGYFSDGISNFTISYATREPGLDSSLTLNSSNAVVSWDISASLPVSFPYVAGPQFETSNQNGDSAALGEYFYEDGVRDACCQYSFASGLTGSWSGPIVLTAAPEPATWGLMVAGVAGLGSVLRRRRGDLALI